MGNWDGQVYVPPSKVEEKRRLQILDLGRTCRELRSKLRKVTKAKIELQIELKRYGRHQKECDVFANKWLAPQHYMACDCGWADVEEGHHYFATAAQATKLAKAIGSTWEEV